MTNALAGLNNPAAIGQNVLTAFQNGRKMRQEMDAQNALMAYSQNPSAESINALLPHKPELALKLMEAERERTFGEAAGRFFGANAPNALAPAQTSAAPQPGSPAQTIGAATAPEAGLPAQPQAAQGDQPPSNPDFRVLGQPQSEADLAFLDMLKADPKRAFQIESSMRDRAAKRLKFQRDGWGMAVARLGSVTDEASYQAALQAIQQQIEPLGVEVTDHLPPNYPGPEGLRSLRLSAVDAKDQLTLFMREADIEADNERADRRVDIYAGNVRADNARADRNTNSVIEDRRGRRAETRRYHDQRDATTRRGQDRRGARETIVSVRTPEEAMKLAPGTKFKTPDGRVKIR